MRYQSWGRFPKAAQKVMHQEWTAELLQRPSPAETLLPRGLGRSYGDSCLNAGQWLLSTEKLNRFISLDRSSGVLRCEAGVTLAEVLELVVPLGWFLPVTPGTKFVTVGGAVANDVHGKNHHQAGNFGHHVTRLELLRSDGTRRICSPSENFDWFAATIGGLGLTGLITWVEFTLKPIYNPMINQEVVRFDSAREFFDISRDSAEDYEYSVAWVDCLARGSSLGRGHFIRGNHAPAREKAVSRSTSSRTVPFDLPSFALNPLTVKAFNTAYYWRQLKRLKRSTVHFDPFFYPLDVIHHWNRIYGRRGFVQYQLVVPYKEDDGAALLEVLGRISRAEQGSFLAVMKIFGDVPSLGMLSFPRSGCTLALDFPATSRVFRLLDELDQVVVQAGGAIYPAKDARMKPETFRASFPRLEEFKQFVDPAFSSSFWRRVS